MQTPKSWQADAPANIALIKYMGKCDHTQNLPTNISLSYTLSNLKTSVALETTLQNQDEWQPLVHNAIANLPFQLDEHSQTRFLKHLARMKQHYHYSGNFIVRSINNFPRNAGLASSASSFAALTRAACTALTELTSLPMPTQKDMAQLARLGSGSACRSFFTPWAIWQEQTAQSIALPYTDLVHRVVLVSRAAKTISSSQAHRLVETSPHFANRPQRAEQRAQALIDALTKQQWQQSYQICWDEFQDMHQLFASATPAFQYMTPEVERILTALQEFWQKYDDGPLITMDAGPNIHLLFRQDQLALIDSLIRETQINRYPII